MHKELITVYKLQQIMYVYIQYIFTCLLHTYSEIPGNDTAMTTSCKSCMYHSAKCPFFTSHRRMLWQEGAFLEALHIKNRCYLICVQLLSAPYSVQTSLPQLWELCVNVTLSILSSYQLSPPNHPAAPRSWSGRKQPRNRTGVFHVIFILSVS